MFRIPRAISEKIAIDIHAVEGKVRQLAQRGIAGTKFIHHNPYADIPKIVQSREYICFVLKQHGFRHLYLKSGSRKRRRLQSPYNRFHQPAIFKLWP